MRHDDITAIILAGGQGSRMGGVDKGLVELQGRPLVEHVIDCIQPQVDNIIISANRNFERYSCFGFTVMPDLWPDYPGPLAGLVSAAALVDTDYLMCVPCDTPHLPQDLADRLKKTLLEQQSEASVAVSDDELHAVCFLMQYAATRDLQHYLESGQRQVQAWLKTKRLAFTDFTDNAHAFANINSQLELQQHEQR